MVAVTTDASYVSRFLRYVPMLPVRLGMLCHIPEHTNLRTSCMAY